MDLATLSLAAGAGMVAALNPCGFALLPAYLSLLVLPAPLDRRPDRAVAVGRALVLTAMMTAGFTVVFALFGLVVSPIASSAQRYLPWVSLVVGLAVLVTGGWLLAGRELPGPRRRPSGPEITRQLRSMFLFGVSYALASLTCTIGPFLAIVVASFRAGTWGEGLSLFVAYALGMGAVVCTAAVAVALANTSLVARLRRTGRWVPRLAGSVLVIVGCYVAYYGWWEIRLLRGHGAEDPVIDTALEVQSWLTRLVSAGAPWLWVALLVTSAGLTTGALIRRGRRGRTTARTAWPRRAADR
ncbi:MAG TPA: cytochrome c biogenesis CcdA family protein [Nocardioidaceae bacterium]|nr:cytochrome c biogenesis CcdA family protein [Nocardioidaceae bacterium]